MTDNINLEFKHSANRNSWFNLEEKEGAEDNDTVKRDIILVLHRSKDRIF